MCWLFGLWKAAGPEPCAGICRPSQPPLWGCHRVPGNAYLPREAQAGWHSSFTQHASSDFGGCLECKVEKKLRVPGWETLLRCTVCHGGIRRLELVCHSWVSQTLAACFYFLLALLCPHPVRAFSGLDFALEIPSGMTLWALLPHPAQKETCLDEELYLILELDDSVP